MRLKSSEQQKTHVIVREHYKHKIKCLISGEMWSLHGLILNIYFIWGALKVLGDVMPRGSTTNKST